MLLATVKGDVHDIGKNIVGVVLGCNNYEVIDMGVMVSCDRILAEAAEKNVDIIGLSGLITPSLDEMVFVGREMERRGIRTPLLIGGATTSPQHTAVKVAPEYGGATVHVLDASRAVDVVSSLLSDRQRDAFVSGTRAEQAKVREKYAGRRERPILTLAEARANHLKTDWDNLEVPAPWFVGRRIIEPPLEDLVPYIDWTFFFSAWELKGRFPAILDHPEYGAAARDLYQHAQALLKRIVAEKLLTARGVYGFWPANAEGDDIAVYKDDSRRVTVARFHMLRQQEPIADGRPNRSLADFVAPRESHVSWTTSAPSPSRPASAPTRSQKTTSANTTTTTRSSSRRWPIGWPRRSRSTCTGRPARTGATARTSRSAPKISSRRNIAAFVQPSAIRPVPITRRRARCSRCSMRRPSASR